jgi:two-component sensor histidine kinase
VLLPFLIFSQIKSSVNPSKKEALALSKTLKAKASSYAEMPHYYPDSITYYANKAIEVLDPKESLHQLYYLQLKFEELNRKKVNPVAKDTLLNENWNLFKNIEKTSSENRFLQYNFLVLWAFTKLQLKDSKNSLALFEKALALINKDDLPHIIAKMNLDKGLYYGRYGLESEKKLSLKYLRQSLNYYKKEYRKYPSEFYMANGELYYYYTTIDKKDSATYSLNEIKLILDVYQKPTLHIWYYCSVGDNFLNNENYKEAEENTLKAVNLIETYNFKRDSNYAYSLQNLGLIEEKSKKYDLAIAYYQKAYNHLKSVNEPYEAINVLKSIAKVYKLKGDLQNALLFQDKFYEESLATQKELNTRSLRESELKVDVLTKDKELVQKGNQQTFLIIILSIGAIMLLLVYRNVRLKQKNNKKLAVINQELEGKNILLDKRNAENELLLKEIHHRVKNNLEVVSGLLALQSAQIDDQSTKDAMQESQNRVNSIGIVHQKLYQGTNLGAVEMKDYVLNLSESILDSFGATGKVHLELAMEKLDLDIDTAVPLGLIINELITNTIKYAFPNNGNGTLTIKLQKTQDTILQLVVSDNGVGKSGITHGTGFGGQLISLLTNQLNGTLTEENENGTTVIIDFKMKKTA